jgi:DNA-binding GntR family transcriptional regulator
MSTPVNGRQKGDVGGGTARSRNPSLAEKAYREIKDLILTSQLRPGELVAAHTLAARYGMSRSPVGQALTLLSQEGLVKVVPRVGYVIPSVSIADVHEIFQLRLDLEGLGAELAATAATDAALDAFVATDAAVRTMAAGLQRDDPSIVRLSIETHASFHLMVAGLSGNNRLVEYIRRLLDESQRIQSLDPRFRYHIGFLVGAHVEVIEALRAHEPQVAREAMASHIRASQERVLRSLLGGDGPEHP